MARAYFTCETKTSLLSHKQITNILGGYCGSLRTDDEVEWSQHRPMRKSKGCSISVGILQATGLRKEAAWGREEMNQGTLWYSKWELEPEESESQWVVGKFLV